MVGSIDSVFYLTFKTHLWGQLCRESVQTDEVHLDDEFSPMLISLVDRLKGEGVLVTGLTTRAPPINSLIA